MPGYQAHSAGGAVVAAAGLTAAWFWAGLRDPVLMTVLAGICLAGALFPDIDTDSKGQKLFYLLLIALDAVLLWRRRMVEAAWLGLGAMVPPLLQHRGFTHTLWCLMLLTGALFFAPQWLGLCTRAEITPFAVAFGAGYASHLLMDHLF